MKNLYNLILIVPLLLSPQITFNQKKGEEIHTNTSIPQINIVIQNSSANNNNITNTNTNDQNSQQISVQTTQVDQQAYNTMYEIPVDLPSYAKKYFSRYHNYIGMGICAAAYGILLYKAWYIRSVAKNSYWTRWAHEHAAHIEQADSSIAQYELLQAIHRRYIDMQNPLNPIYALVLFLQDLKQELIVLHRCHRYSSWIRHLYMHWLVPFSIPQSDIFSEHIRQLYHLQELFIQWTTLQKMSPR